ncbi:unnamed protein product [Adineta steineri]|uniref:PKS/mFAS DH domain-containing protein n=1 Tax=Adineta steineri TaxID=433720 RepID=A0A819UPR4_9BILA|nr:unnamed protein product [Adineta steineri]
MTKINNGEWRLLEELIEKKNEQESRINDTNIAQPPLFAIQVALAALLVSWNIYPSFIISHSAGDEAAAFVADRLSLVEAVRILAVLMSEEEVENKLLKGIEHLACIAVVNSLRSDEAANVFLEISPHPVLATSIRECCKLTNQQQSSPLILLTLKRKEDEQITLLPSLAQLTTSSQVWQQYCHTRQILPMKNHAEYCDNFPLYKFHLSPSNRIQTHPLLDIRQLNEQTSATWKSLININLPQHSFLQDHKIQDAVLFPAVVYLELATAACQQLLSSKEDDQQQLTIIFEDVNFIKALILNEHELVEVCIQIIMPMREWSIILCNQDNLNKYSLNQFTLHAQEPFNELAAYYAQMVIKDLDLNQQHHPLLNACRSLASTTNKGVTWHSTQLRLIQLIERFPHILSGEKNGLDIFFGDDDEVGETFRQVKTLISATKTQHIFHSICQHLQLQYEQQIKDNSFENYRLRIFWLSDSHCSYVLPILDLLLNLSQQTGLSIDLHYADSDPTQLANAQQTFNTHINNQTKNLSIIYDETIDLYDSKTLEQISFESFDIIFSANQLLVNQDLINCLISLRRLLVSNGLVLLLELVHVPLYFDLIFCFNDQWWSSSDDNNRSLNNIQRWTPLVEQIEGSNIIESTLNQNETFKQNEELICGTLSLILQTIQKSSPYFHPFVYVLTDHAQFNNDSNLNIIPSPFIGLARSLITEYERHRLQLIDLQTSLNNNN